YPWNDKANGGFSDHQPWLPVAQQAPGVNWQDEQIDPDSVWHFYQKLCQLRNDSPLRSDLIDGDFTPLTVEDEHIIAYARGKHLRIYVNLSAASATIDLPAGRIWLNNYPDAAPTLKPYQAILIEVN
ncbi:alpha-amylase family glycosyl hydrolase, partial [Lacticaseibacillus rhamnosus]|nr:alpha-glucosidase [Lacticaseibacillus rhamnosus]